MSLASKFKLTLAAAATASLGACATAPDLVSPNLVASQMFEQAATRKGLGENDGARRSAIINQRCEDREVGSLWWAKVERLCGDIDITVRTDIVSNPATRFRTAASPADVLEYGAPAAVSATPRIDAMLGAPRP